MEQVIRGLGNKRRLGRQNHTAPAGEVNKSKSHLMLSYENLVRKRVEDLKLESYVQIDHRNQLKTTLSFSCKGKMLSR